MLEALGADAPRFGAMSPGACGWKQAIYLLPKELTLALIAEMATTGIPVGPWPSSATG